MTVITTIVENILGYEFLLFYNCSRNGRSLNRLNLFVTSPSLEITWYGALLVISGGTRRRDSCDVLDRYDMTWFVLSHL